MVQVLFEAADHAFFFGRWPKGEAARILEGERGSRGPFSNLDDFLAVVGEPANRQKMVRDIRSHAGWTGLHGLAIASSKGREAADRFASAFEDGSGESEAYRTFERFVDRDWWDLAQTVVWPSGDGDLGLVLCSQDRDLRALEALLRQGADALGVDCRKVHREDPEYAYF